MSQDCYICQSMFKRIIDVVDAALKNVSFRLPETVNYRISSNKLRRLLEGGA